MATRKATQEEIERLGLDEAAAGAAPKKDWDAVSFATGVARSIGQGITFGFADEAEAYVRSVLGDQTYEEAKKATNAELAKFRGENPFLSFGLEIGAAIMTPGGLLKIASKVPGLAKVAQKGMQTTTPVTRGMAGGALYGAGTAETMEDVPASMALGGTLGYAGTKMAPAVTDAAKKLMQRGIPLSIGQRFGGSLGKIEEGLSKLPVTGEMIGPTRIRAVQRFATAAYNEALDPIGKKIKPNTDPRKAAEQAQTIFNQAYDDALEGVDIEVTDEVIDQITKLIDPYKARLLPQQAEQLEKFVIDQIINRTVNNRLSGEAIKEAQSSLGPISTGFSRSTDAYQKSLGEALRELDAELLEIVAKQFPAKAEKLTKVNQSYSMYYPIREAAAGATDSMFSPSQLLSAIRRQEKKMGAAGLSRLAKGEGRLQDFAETAVETLGSKVPESAPLRPSSVLLMGGGGYLDPVLTGAGLGVGKAVYTPFGQAVTGGVTVPSRVPLMGGRQAGVIPTISAGMRSPATAGLLAAEAEPTVSPMVGGLLGIPSAEAGMLPGTGEARIPEPGIRYETITDRLGRPVTYAITDGGASMTRVTP